MLRWMRRRRERAERIEADAEALIRAFDVKAYTEARRFWRDASDPEVAAHYNDVARIIARRTGKNVDLDTVPPLHALLADPTLMDELVRAISQVPQRVRFRVQFLGVSSDRGLAILKEVDVASDESEALPEAAHIAWPPRTIGFRLIDREGAEVLWRLKADRREVY